MQKSFSILFFVSLFITYKSFANLELEYQESMELDIPVANYRTVNLLHYSNGQRTLPISYFDSQGFLKTKVFTSSQKKDWQAFELSNFYSFFAHYGKYSNRTILTGPTQSSRGFQPGVYLISEGDTSAKEIAHRILPDYLKRLTNYALAYQAVETYKKEIIVQVYVRTFLQEELWITAQTSNDGEKWSILDVFSGPGLETSIPFTVHQTSRGTLFTGGWWHSTENYPNGGAFATVRRSLDGGLNWSINDTFRFYPQTRRFTNSTVEFFLSEGKQIVSFGMAALKDPKTARPVRRCHIRTSYNEGNSWQTEDIDGDKKEDCRYSSVIKAQGCMFALSSAYDFIKYRCQNNKKWKKFSMDDGSERYLALSYDPLTQNVLILSKEEDTNLFSIKKILNH